MVIDGLPVNVGQWTHLALVYDQEKGFANPTEQAILYVDGAKFHAMTMFNGAHFRDWARFAAVQFLGWARFSRATFVGSN